MSGKNQGGDAKAELKFPACPEEASLDRVATDPPARLEALSGQRELHEIEVAAVTCTATPKALEAFVKWSERYWTVDGLFAPAPWSTFRFLPAIARIRHSTRTTGWSEAAEGKFARLVEAVVRLSVGNGWIRTEGGPSSDSYRRMIQTLLHEPGFRELRKGSHWIWEPKLRPPSGKIVVPGLQSDEASLALLRRDWSQNPTYLAVDYSRPAFDAVFCLNSRPVLLSSWDVEIRCSDKKIAHLGEWENTCWFADMDGEYAEFRRLMGGGIILERQLYLSRRMGLLLLADTLKSPMDEPLELTWRWPLANGVSLSRDVAGQLSQLAFDDRSIRLLPFAWPFASSNGANDAESGRIAIEQDRLSVSSVRNSKRLFMPLALHWNFDESKPQLPWTALTITNDRRPVAPDEAVAFRIPLDAEQIVFFRALRRLERYAYLGYQTRAECMLADFDSKGTMHEWVLVE